MTFVPRKTPWRPKRQPTLHKGCQDLASRLQKRVADDDAEKLFETSAATLNDVVAESVREDFAGQGRNGHASAFALENVAEVLKVGIAAAHARGSELEGGYVGAADDLIVGVHAAAHAVGSGIADLRRGAMSERQNRWVGVAEEDELSVNAERQR